MASGEPRPPLRNSLDTPVVPLDTIERIPPRLGGERYVLEQPIAAGTQGAVYRALDTTLGRPVAIKVFERAAGDGRPPAISEAYLQGRLRHPGIAAVLDADLGAPHPYVVFEYVGGQTLGERLWRGAVSADEARGISFAVLEALAHAHGQGVVHGDLSPNNILLAETGRVVLIDFGFAGPPGSLGGQGTPGYAAPERLRSESASATADVFSLGALVYALCTRAPPSPIVLDRLPKALQLVVARCLEPVPGARWATCAALRQALDQAWPADAAPPPAATETDRLGMLGEAIGLLREAADAAADASLDRAEIELLAGRLGRLLAEPPEHPRVALFGDIKAGKSTLVNALLGEHVAATDVLELTSCNSEFHPTTTPAACRLVRKDGTSTGVSLTEFLARSRDRSLPAAWTTGLDHVEIGVARPLPFTLIDTPGAGGLGVGHEEALQRAMESADLLLWVLDCNALGDARGSVIVEDAHSKGLETWLVLTQIDTLEDEAQLSEVVQWARARSRIPPDRIYPVSALRAIEGDSATGHAAIRQLRELLAHDVPARKVDLRRQARNAHVAQLGEDAAVALGRLDELIGRHERALTRLRTELEPLGGAVLAEVQETLRGAAAERFLTHRVEPLTVALTVALQTSAQGLSTEAVERVFRQVVPDSEIEQYWQREIGNAQTALVDGWRRELETRGHGLGRALDIDASTRSGDVSGFVASATLPELVHSVASEQFDTAMKTSLGVAGLASAWAAWIGPAAPLVTIGQALTGVGLPLALFGLGIAYYLKSRDKPHADAAASARRHAERCVEAARARIRTDMIDRLAVPVLEQVNERVIDALLDEFALSKYGGFKPARLRAVRARAAALAESLPRPRGVPQDR